VVPFLQTVNGYEVS